MVAWRKPKFTMIAAMLAACTIGAPLAMAAEAASTGHDLVDEIAANEGEDFLQEEVDVRRGRPTVKLRAIGHAAGFDARLRFELKSDHDGFAHFYSLGASGNVEVWLENVPVKAGRSLSYPSGRLTVQIRLPHGRERLVAVVTRERIDGFLGTGTTRLPHLLSESHANFWLSLNATLADLPRTSWGQASIRLDTAR